MNNKVDTLETATNQKVAATDGKVTTLAATHTKDVSQLDERISTTDMKLAQTTGVATGAQNAAAEAKAAADANAAKIAANSQSISTLTTGVANSLNYQLVEKADVTFGFGKYMLTSDAKAALNQVATKAQSLPRFLVEVVGFTDRTGSAGYNLALSRRRAEEVERYLITQKVPLRTIHTVGMGEEAPPPDLAADSSARNPNPSKADLKRLARRVHIRIYGAGDIGQPTQAAGADQ